MHRQGSFVVYGADKYILNSRGEQSEKAELIGNTVTYTGSAVIQDNDIHFNQLCREDGNRIRYKKVCASCGKEVKSEDIVKGF